MLCSGRIFSSRLADVQGAPPFAHVATTKPVRGGLRRRQGCSPSLLDKVTARLSEKTNTHLQPLSHLNAAVGVC